MRRAKIADIVLEKITGEWGEEPREVNGVRVLRTTNFTNEGRLNMNSVVEREIDDRIVEKKKLKYGDTIIEKSGGSPNQPVGRVVFFDIEDEQTYLCNNFTAILRPREDVFPKFFFYSLFYKHLNKATLRYQNKTTGIINLQLERYLQEEIPLPPLPIQKQIAVILEKADAAREKRRQANKLTEQFLQSAFLEMFGDPVTNPKGWDVVELYKCCNKVTDGTHFPPKFRSLGIPFIFVSNVRNGDINLRTDKYITQKEYEELNNRCPVEIGDVLYTTVGSYGNAAVVRTTKPFSFQRHIAHLKPNYSKVLSVYLAMAMESQATRIQVDQQVRGVAQKTLNLRELRNVKVCIPPLSEQNKFVTLVEKVESLRAKQRESEKELENLFGSLMQRAFRGELVG